MTFERAPTDEGTRGGRRVAGGRPMALVVSRNVGAVGGAFVIAESGWPEEEEGDTVNAVAVVEQVFVFWAAADCATVGCGATCSTPIAFCLSLCRRARIAPDSAVGVAETLDPKVYPGCAKMRFRLVASLPRFRLARRWTC